MTIETMGIMLLFGCPFAIFLGHAIDRLRARCSRLELRCDELLGMRENQMKLNDTILGALEDSIKRAENIESEIKRLSNDIH